MQPELISRLKRATEQVQRMLVDARTENGHWIGELSASALSTATAISAFSFYLESKDECHHRQEIESQIRCGCEWLESQQNDDGGWGDTDKNYSNISTTLLVIAAFHAAERAEEFREILSAAQDYVESQGGVDGIRRRYGNDKTFAVPILANAAMSGLVEWREVGVLPFEAACVPQRFYHLLNLPVVSYAIPALVAIGQVKFHFDPPRNPLIRWIRQKSIRRSLDVLERMQPESGGFLEAIPLTSFVCMALIKCGKQNHPVVKSGIGFLLDSFRVVPEKMGSWPIDTNLATWVTTLSLNALTKDSEFQLEHNQWKSCFNWLLDCQYKTQHPFTGAAPGGWGWSDLTGSVPDADDTPGALLALDVFWRSGQFEGEKVKIIGAAKNGLNWLLGLQNSDGGWPTFCRGWGRLPFDRSGSDLTAHVIRAFCAWGEVVGEKRCKTAIDRGFKYLEKNQNVDGSWLPLWFGNQDQVDDINPFYGTAKVLHAYHDSGRLHTKTAQNGLKWIRENQNPDGGWGGGPSVRFSDSLPSSSVEETALCAEALLWDDNQVSRVAAESGLSWLISKVEQNSIHESTPIGFYFAKLWYFEKLYPLIFATSALGSGSTNLGRQEISWEKKLDSIQQ